MSQLRTLLRAHPSLVEHKDPALGCSSLFRTVICEQLEATQLLLEHQANPNLQNSSGETPLHHASENVAQLLLQHGANPNVPQHDGDTPLHYAAFKGHSKLAQLLLDSGAVIDQSNTLSHSTPLHYAVDTDNVDVARVLLEAQANASLKNSRGQTPAKLVRSEAMKQLLQEFSVIKPKVARSKTVSTPRTGYGLPNRAGSFTDRHPLRSWLRTLHLEELFEVLQEAGYDDPEQMMKQMQGMQEKMMELSQKKRRW